jgi:pantetheine-phosphate adenylyltransferase
VGSFYEPEAGGAISAYAPEGFRIDQKGWTRYSIESSVYFLYKRNENMERIAIYPGSFDPVTNGHLDILERGLKLFDKIILAILTNPKKKFLFSLEQRIEMLEESIKEFPNVKIDTFDGLTVDFAAQCHAQGILRGLRAMSDFEYEFQMALMNRRLNREVQTVFLMTGLRWIYTSSSIIKEAAQFGGNIKGMVPPIVEQKIKEKYARGS